MSDNSRPGKIRNPWAWIPTLYFAQGLPYVVAMTVVVIMYKRLGISNTDITLYTSWLYLPWVIKPFWSPFVDRDDIEVTVHGGVATLTGTVGTWIGYGEADKDARKSGAGDVINRIEVK